MTRKFTDMKELAAVTQENGNIIAVTLLELREALGYNRLGVRVLGYIADALDGEGLGYFPDWILNGGEHSGRRAGDLVRVFKKGTAVGDVVTAVSQPTSMGDQRLREIAGGDAAETLRRVRELVAE